MKKCNSLQLYFSYIRIHFKAGLQYKGWPLMLLQTFLNVITDPISTVLLFSRFGSIGEWSMERILLIYAMAVTSFGLAETFARGFDCFPYRMVQGGAFDRVLLRPRSTFVQVAASEFHIHRLARVASGIGVSLWCLGRLGIPMNLSQTVLFVYALFSGLVLYTGVFVLTSGISFFTIKGIDWIYIFTNAGYQVTRCPVPLMPELMKNTFTFLIPILVISYYPASALCGWGEPLWKGLLALPAGLLFLSASLLLWRVGILHYKSTGS